MPPTDQNCANCLCWTRFPAEAQKVEQPARGLCRLNPPSVFLLPIKPKDTPEDRKFTMQHPVMLEGGWCGQWKPIEDAADHKPAKKGTR